MNTLLLLQLQQAFVAIGTAVSAPREKGGRVTALCESSEREVLYRATMAACVTLMCLILDTLQHTLTQGPLTYYCLFAANTTTAHV